MSESLQSLLHLLPSESADGNEWIAALRREALSKWTESGVPTRRLEDWKGTNLAPLAAMEFGRVGPGSSGIDFSEVGPEFIFVDGRLDREASRLADLPAGLRAASLADLLVDEPELVRSRLAQLPDVKLQSLVALNTAFLEDGAVLIIDAGVEVEHPIRIRFVTTTESAASQESSGSVGTSTAAFPRLLVVAGEASHVTLLQEHVSHSPTQGTATGFTAYVSEFHLAAGAAIESVEIQAEDAGRIHFTSAHAELARDARFHSHVYSLGNGLVRSELAIRLNEPDAEATLCGLFLGRDDGHIDHFTTVDHAAERCSSDEEYRGVLADRSSGVFRGRVIVRPGAQKTDARQSNPNLLLSEEATIDSKPQLEIYADDIRASHGSTIGQLDEDALFFLRARGMGATDARRMLTGAFAQGIVARISNHELRQTVASRVDAVLASLEGKRAEDPATSASTSHLDSSRKGDLTK